MSNTPFEYMTRMKEFERLPEDKYPYGINFTFKRNKRYVLVSQQFQPLYTYQYQLVITNVQKHRFVETFEFFDRVCRGVLLGIYSRISIIWHSQHVL